MALTTLSGPLQVGDKAGGVSGGPNLGNVVLAQTVTVNRDATLVQTVSFNVPPNTQLQDFLIDVLTAYDSATSATLTIGTAAAGTQYVGAINAKTAGRAAPTLSAAQLAAMSSTTTNTTVYVTVTSVGQPTVGQVQVVARYVQTSGI